jgi:adenosine deaminase
MTSLLSTSPTEAFLSGQTAPGTPTSKAAATPMIDVNEEFLRALPKTDLHVHLDGSLRINTLIDLSKKDGKELPAYDEAGLRKLVFKDTYSNLEEYLQGFMYTSAVMQSAENMERIAFEFAEDNYSEGVRYFEVRFAPQLHADAGKAGDAGFDILQVLTAVNAGLKRAKNAFNSTLASPEEPPYEYGIIVCAMRMFEPFFSRYFTELDKMHPYVKPNELASIASTALVRAALHARDHHNLPIVALDIAGAEAGFEATVHKDAYDLAHSHYLKKTVHAGEAYGPESIAQAVKYLHAERIGHGYHIFSDDKVVGKHNRLHAQEYVDQLVEYVSTQRITLEVCLTSNLQTMPELVSQGLKAHAFRKMVDNRLSITVNTDNRLVSNTNTVKELGLAIDTFALTPKQLNDIVIAGFKKSFFPKKYVEKRAYVRMVMNYYNEICRKFGVALE